MKIGLFNDSFPPTIDGVANTMLNYAKILTDLGDEVTVVTPKYPNVTDNYPFEVYRYNSANFRGEMPYRVGNPFAPISIHNISKKKLELMHIHSPFASSVLVDQVTMRMEVPPPILITYHTKFELDIERYVSHKLFQKISKWFVLTNMNKADEVWVVSEGTKDSLRKIGYEKDVVIMPNGTDFPKGKASADLIREIDRIYGTQSEQLVFLYCGRMMWYKNTKVSLDALKILKDEGIGFKAFFVGDGADRPSIEAYATDIGLEDNTFFTGPIINREKVRAFFSRADLFLFPSTYDTSGLVVKEAAACGCGSALIKGSCAAEGIEDGVNGLIADEETGESFAKVLLNAVKTPGFLKTLGENAQRDIYLSWDDSVRAARKRYDVIVEKKAEERLRGQKG
ncbi:MAG: glycosyltransferase [Clostridia bacterium]|nr:glycosyltransferase [Clostridia bacterium]